MKLSPESCQLRKREKQRHEEGTGFLLNRRGLPDGHDGVKYSRRLFQSRGMGRQGMERQKNDMEKETYSLKHELVSTQMKLEAVLKGLGGAPEELDRLNRRTAQTGEAN